MWRPMTDGQLVAFTDGTQAQLKQVKVTGWQTVFVAVEMPAPASTESKSQR